MQDNLVTFCCARKTKKERKAGKKRNIESGEVEGAASKVEEAQSSTVVLSSPAYTPVERAILSICTRSWLSIKSEIPIDSAFLSNLDTLCDNAEGTLIRNLQMKASDMNLEDSEIQIIIDVKRNSQAGYLVKDSFREERHRREVAQLELARDAIASELASVTKQLNESKRSLENKIVTQLGKKSGFLSQKLLLCPHLQIMFHTQIKIKFDCAVIKNLCSAIELKIFTFLSKCINPGIEKKG
jgi:hypothetical protein